MFPKRRLKIVELVCYKTQGTARSNHSVWIKTKTALKKFFISDNVSMLNLSSNELKLVAKLRGIKGYKSMSKERLLWAFSESESEESATPLSKISFDDERL